MYAENYIEVVTSPDPSQRGAQLSIMFSYPIDEVSKAIQAKGAAVSTLLATYFYPLNKMTVLWETFEEETLHGSAFSRGSFRRIQCRCGIPKNLGLLSIKLKFMNFFSLKASGSIALPYLLEYAWAIVSLASKN